MSVFERTALGLDHGDGTLKAVLLSARGRRVRLRRCWRLPYAHEPSLDAGWRAALAGFLARARPGVLPRIVVAAPDRGHLGQTYVVPIMEAGRLADLVRYELLAASRARADELLLAHHVRQGVAENQVHAVALRAGPVRDLLTRLQQLGLPFDEFQPPAWALASFVEHERPVGRDRVVLGVGEVSTTLLLMREDGLWSRHLPFGLRGALDDASLARALHAETASAISGLLPSDRDFAPVDVVLTEEGALGSGLTSALRAAFDLPVTRIGELRRVLPPRRVHPGDPPAAESLCMARAFGLALAGLGLARFQGPLPLADDPRRVLNRRLPLVAASLLLSAGGLLALTVQARQQVARLDALLPAHLGRELADGTARAAELALATSRKQSSLQRLGDLVQRRPQQFALRRALAAVSEVAATRGELALHVESCGLTTGAAGRPGLLDLTIEAAPGFDEVLAERLLASFAQHGLAARVDSLRPGTARGGLSIWRLLVELP